MFVVVVDCFFTVLLALYQDTFLRPTLPRAEARFKLSGDYAGLPSGLYTA